MAWKVLRKPWKVREYQNSLPHLSQIPKGQGQYLNTDQPGESGLAGVVNTRLISLQVIQIEILDFLAFLSEKGYEYSSINSHRSAISVYHVHIDNNPIGQHPRVCTLMTGIFNNYPPKL